MSFPRKMSKARLHRRRELRELGRSLLARLAGLEQPGPSDLQALGAWAFEAGKSASSRMDHPELAACMTPSEAGRLGAQIVAATRSPEDKLKFALMGANAFWGSSEARRSARLAALESLPNEFTGIEFASAACITSATAKTALAEFAAAGLVEVLRVGRRGKGGSSIYRRLPTEGTAPCQS